MKANAGTGPGSNKAVWAGRISTGIIGLFLISVSLIGIIKSDQMAPQMVRMGYPLSLAIKIPIVCITCAVIYLIPQTSIFGAILLTAYLGGATAPHVRIGEPFFFPVLFAVLAW